MILASKAASMLASLFGIDGGATSTYYMGLLHVMPSSNGQGWTEVSGTEYARIETNKNGPHYGPQFATGTETGTAEEGTANIVFGKIYSADEIRFPVARTGAWTSAVGYGIWTSRTGGQLIYWAPFESAEPVEVGIGWTPVFYPNELKVRLA